MNVEIINVGTELLLGEIINTNATYLQKMCRELGFNVYYQTVVGDNPHRFEDCLQIAFERGANCVITTGGLGPTQDDLTKELSAKFLGLEMIYNQDEAKKVDDKCKFVTGLSQITDNNFKQAYFPKDCFILENEVGTANGCIMSKDQRMIVNLPGPPKEMTYVVDHVLKPYLSQYKEDVIYTHDIVTMGIGESMVDHELEDIIEKQKDVSIALYASEESVRIRLGHKASSKEIANEKMKDLVGIIERRLGDHVIHGNIKDLLEKDLPKCHIDNQTNLCLSSHFLNYHEGNDLLIIMEMKEEALGQRVLVTYKYQGDMHCFDVPLLKDAQLSLSKLEAKMRNQLYIFLKGKA